MKVEFMMIMYRPILSRKRAEPLLFKIGTRIQMATIMRGANKFQEMIRLKMITACIKIGKILRFIRHLSRPAPRKHLGLLPRLQILEGV